MKPALDSTLQFGRVFSDHMLCVEWTDGRGWGVPRIQPLQALSLHPAAQTLQYGAQCFEGMKAYAGPDGRPRLFRPELNTARLLRSAVRLALPSFDCAELQACLAALLRVEADWVPRLPGFSLYLRPTLVATTPFLGVGPPQHATLFVVLSPCGPYVTGPPQAVRLYLEEGVVRAAPGGVGSYKVGGNYAPTVAPALAAARRHGATQVLYTYQPEGGVRVIQEAGAMNVFVLLEDAAGRPELITPPLDGTILPGVTRASLLGLAAMQPGLTVSQRALPVDELAAAASAGRLLEVFCSGTAAVVLPVQCLVRENGEELAAKPYDPQPGAMLSSRLAAKLSDIQYGRVQHEWSVPIDAL